ncbi:MAG TPA: SDR family oxidoreductase [Burkholderiales bacterium]|jgi:NAD(P)-dependent dehydrogenase (short-subunit alcohol dehydrogenase family)|nr:SDR family oxidoreductase [Burkholderiales bacterium]
MAAPNRCAVVTGAGSGIGRAVALAFLKDGYRVALAGRRKEMLEQTVSEAGAAGKNALVVPTDVGKPDAVRALFAAVRKEFGRLDVLFNNAGGGATAPLEDLTLEQWQGVVDVNFNGMFYCAQEAFRIMKDQNPRGGRIINNGSISAHAPRPNSIAYTATKHGVTGITRTISLDGRKYDIACGQIDIGNAVTPLTERMAKGVMQANGTVATEPRMDVVHVGNAVLFMANLPLDVNVQFMTIMATKMPFVGRG